VQQLPVYLQGNIVQKQEYQSIHLLHNYDINKAFTSGIHISGNGAFAHKRGAGIA
jgi:hypothetical protein